MHVLEKKMYSTSKNLLGKLFKCAKFCILKFIKLDLDKASFGVCGLSSSYANAEVIM